MSETKQLSAELHETYGSENRQFRNELTAHIKVLEDGEWIGDFFATFTRQRLGGSDKYVADWASLKQGNGIYTDREPCFWPVEEIAKELNEKYELQEFVALDTGPNDIQMNTPDMFYCCDNNLNSTDAFSGRCVMLSGGMVYKISENFSFTIPPCDKLFIDSGGFQATASWDMSYPYEPKTLFEWAESIGADYVAMPDFACEPELHETSVMHRVARTVEEHAYAQHQYDQNDYSFDLIPVLQGYYPDQYDKCIDLFEQEGLIRDYMAVGTVCKRDSVDAIHTVMETIEQRLPDVEFHMFGMTLNAWKDRRMWGRFRSADTAAWNWGGQTTDEKKQLLKEYSAKVDAIRRQMTGQTTL